MICINNVAGVGARHALAPCGHADACDRGAVSGLVHFRARFCSIAIAQPAPGLQRRVAPIASARRGINFYLCLENDLAVTLPSRISFI